jgi:hypothetical protein
MRLKYLIIVACFFVLLFQSACKKKICITCSNVSIITGSAVATAEGCSKDEYDATREAMDKLPTDQNAVVRCYPE